MKTVVGDNVWQALATGNFQAAPLPFGEKQSDKVTSHGAHVVHETFDDHFLGFQFWVAIFSKFCHSITNGNHALFWQ